MNINDFMCNIPIYIIHLPDSIDRKNHISNTFKDYQNIKIVDAVDGRKSDNFKNNYNITYTSSISYTDPLIAVICSHAKAIKLAYMSNEEKVCVFEDDVHTDLISTCSFNLNDICNLQNDWDAIQLFYTYGNASIIDVMHNHYLENGVALVKRDINYSGTCYIINRKGMKKFLDNVVLVNDDMNTFTIKHNIIDPEAIIFEYINTYIINRQLFYYYFPTMTFDCYTMSDSNSKIACQDIHYITQRKLRIFYS